MELRIKITGTVTTYRAGRYTSDANWFAHLPYLCTYRKRKQRVWYRYVLIPINSTWSIVWERERRSVLAEPLLMFLQTRILKFPYKRKWSARELISRYFKKSSSFFSAHNTLLSAGGAFHGLDSLLAMVLPSHSLWIEEHPLTERPGGRVSKLVRVQVPRRHNLKSSGLGVQGQKVMGPLLIPTAAAILFTVRVEDFFHGFFRLFLVGLRWKWGGTWSGVGGGLCWSLGGKTAENLVRQPVGLNLL